MSSHPSPSVGTSRNHSHSPATSSHRSATSKLQSAIQQSGTTSTPGIINLPQPSSKRGGGATSATAPSTTSTSQSARRQQRSRGTRGGQQQQEKTAGTSAAPGAVASAITSAAAPEQPTSTSTSTPNKTNTRTRQPKQHRQISPPTQDSNNDAFAAPHHSHSAPASSVDLLALGQASSQQGQQRRNRGGGRQRTQQQQYESHGSGSGGSGGEGAEDDGWDMPSAQTGARAAGAAGVEGLTWQQQEGLKRSNTGPSSSSRRQGQGQGRASQQRSHSQQQQSRPLLHPSLSDSQSQTQQGGVGGLTWQQALLASSSSAPASDTVLAHSRHLNSSPLKHSHAHGTGQHTPSKSKAVTAVSRRQQARDDETFGPSMSSLSLSHSPSQPQSPRRSAPQSAPRPSRSAHDQTLLSTPTKLTEARYAGPTFHNSPLPSSLPVPSFLLKRMEREKGMGMEAGA